jgi:hypothetical protein
MLAIADRAIALGAKPPADPFQKLMREVMDIWERDSVSHQGPYAARVEMIVLHVLRRAKEMGL